MILKILIILFIYICLGYILEYSIIKYFLGYIPYKYKIEFEKESIIIYHNGLKESYCIDEGDKIIKFQNEFKINKFIIIFLKFLF